MGRPRKNPAAPVAAATRKVNSLEGVFDAICETDALWDSAVRRLHRFSRVYGFNRLETPLVEDMNLYQNFYGGNKQSVQSVLSLLAAGKQVGVRPALLPSVLRAYGQGKVYEQAPLSKWSSIGPVIHQDPETLKLSGDLEFCFEVFGSFNHLTEAQAIGVVWDYLQSLGLRDIVLEINNIGTSESQMLYQETLQDFLSAKKYQLCDSCNEHLSGRVLNVFRCNNLDCQAIVSESPTILDFLDQPSHKHFTNILEALDELGIPYQLSPSCVAPEGYSKTNVAIRYKSKGQTVTIGEGGYQDGLLHSVSGKNFSAFGFIGSLSKVRAALEQTNPTLEREQHSDVFLVPLGELAAKKSLRLFRDLIAAKVSVYDHFGNLGVKNQLKQAETFKAPVALIMGQKEAMDEMVILRDVKSGMQEIISYDKIVEEVKKRLGR